MKLSKFCIQVLSTLPSDEVVYRTMSHSFTAKELMEGLETRNDDALMWATSLAQIVVDFLSRNKSSKAQFLEFEEIAKTIESAIFIRLLEQLCADSEKVVFFNGVKKYNKNRMIEEFNNNSPAALEYACAFLSWTKKLILSKS